MQLRLFFKCFYAYDERQPPLTYDHLSATKDILTMITVTYDFNPLCFISSNRPLIIHKWYKKSHKLSQHQPHGKVRFFIRLPRP